MLLQLFLNTILLFAMVSSQSCKGIHQENNPIHNIPLDVCLIYHQQDFNGSAIFQCDEDNMPKIYYYPTDYCGLDNITTVNTQCIYSYDTVECFGNICPYSIIRSYFQNDINSCSISNQYTDSPIIVNTCFKTGIFSSEIYLCTDTKIISKQYRNEQRQTH